jgi:signal transduction histidine kinase
MLLRQPALDEGLPQIVAAAHEGVESWLAIQVIDSGRGIAPADQERVFEEFEQVDAGPRADSPNRGTGLGLAISRRLARLLGGDLLLASEPGKGSTFTLWLPASEAESGTL